MEAFAVKIKEIIENWLVLCLLVAMIMFASSLLQEDFHSSYNGLLESVQRIKLKLSLALG